ncbi:hypothetical protein SCLCIDRAFT_1217721 [Scleroderma citrinum Foug A]|uniref:Uncharacterized protein n=1 Tax=Scleroderma citrinum Foug A TaxID=1036808 RepID=A0A0C3DT39_9AGAM|nr:hypothetical protein SCLCIDRAFT_1217721 [Scleroderma citrinum Foug A]
MACKCYTVYPISGMHGTFNEDKGVHLLSLECLSISAYRCSPTRSYDAHEAILPGTLLPQPPGAAGTRTTPYAKWTS